MNGTCTVRLSDHGRRSTRLRRAERTRSSDRPRRGTRRPQRAHPARRLRQRWSAGDPEVVRRRHHHHAPLSGCTLWHSCCLFRHHAQTPLRPFPQCAWRRSDGGRVPLLLQLGQSDPCADCARPYARKGCDRVWRGRWCFVSDAAFENTLTFDGFGEYDVSPASASAVSSRWRTRGCRAPTKITSVRRSSSFRASTTGRRSPGGRSRRPVRASISSGSNSTPRPIRPARREAGSTSAAAPSTF